MKSTSLLARTALAGALVSLSLACAAQAQQAAATDRVPVLVPTVRAAHATRATMLASTRAGERIVAVGDHGVVLLSDDGGRSHRQARQVPVDVALTSVSFIDARQGWAAGHWGVILHTEDGGETWQIQRSDAAQDRPLFAVHFFDEKQGVAVGLWSLVLRTEDGGVHWQPVELAPPQGGKRADLNLFGLFTDARGRLFAPAERGMVLRSEDKGRSWNYMQTGYAGSFWSGIAGPGGTLLAAGLRGSMYRSVDDGSSWQRVDTHTESSITALAGAGKKIVAVGLDGLVLSSEDGGASFAAHMREDRLPLTSVALDGQGHAAMYSRQGVVAGAGAKDPSAR